MVECNCHGMRDIWVVALDNETQEIIWQGCYGGSEDDAVVSILNENSNYMIVGGTHSSDGDIMSSYHGGGDAWVLQIDIDGQLIWERCFGGSGGEYIKNIYKTEDNGYLLFGVTNSEDGDVNQTHCPYANCGSNTWVIELGSNKNILWNKVVGPIGWNSWHEKNAIKRIGERDFMIAGIIEDTDNHSGDVDCEPYPINSGKSAWIYRLYDPNTGIKQNSISFGLATYPNPASQKVVFEIPKISTKSEIEIKDVFGKSVAELPLFVNQTQVIWNCSGVASGVYFYHAEIDGILYKGKILIE